MNTGKPDWFDLSTIAESIDAREMLQRGEHPLALVLERSNLLPSKAILELITPFLPQPLIDRVKALGLESYTETVLPDELHTYFYKP